MTKQDCGKGLMMGSLLVPSMREAIFESSTEELGDVIAEVAEAGLDALLEDGVIQRLPLIGAVVSLYKTGLSIRELSFIKQTAVFIESFNDGSIAQEKLDAHRKKLEDNPKEADRELERVMLLLDRTIDAKRSRVLGKLYGSYVKGAIEWEVFVELSEVNSRMYVEDYGDLQRIGSHPISQHEKVPARMEYRLRRLESQGLVMEQRARLFGGNVLETPDSDERFILSPLGATFYSVMGRD